MIEPLINEEDVIDAVCRYLQRKSFTITKRLRTTERGIDIIAESTRDKKTVLVEAKGDTSTRRGTKRYGKPFNASQIRSHTGMALLKAAEMLQEGGCRKTTVCIALPDSERQRRLLKEIEAGLRRLRVTLLLVDPVSRKVLARPPL